MRISILLWVLLFVSPSFASPFTDNGNFTVTDSATGLIWQQCSAGFSGTSCATGTATTFTWQNALSFCNSLVLDGKTWRLPNINELKSIIDRSRVSPAINITSFPGTSSNNHWSSTTDINSGAANANAWVVQFSDGSVSNLSAKSNTFTARCVAGP